MTNYEIFLNCIEKAEQHKSTWEGNLIQGSMRWFKSLSDEERKVMEFQGYNTIESRLNFYKGE